MPPYLIPNPGCHYPITGKELALTAGISARATYVPKRVDRSVSPLAALLVLVGGAGVLFGLLGAPWLAQGQSWVYWSTTLDVLNNFLPVWAALLALGLTVALARRQRTSRLFLAGTALLLTVALVPVGLELYRAPQQVAYGPGADPSRAIRLIQFNALNSTTDLGPALDLALEQDVDLLLIEEPIAFRQLHAYLKARYPFSTPCPGERCKAVIYSRLPPIAVNYETLRGSWYSRGPMKANGQLGLASMRLRGPDGEPFTAIATHLLWPYPPMPVRHQREVLLRHLAGEDHSRTILAGDFNLTPWTFQMRRFDTEIGPMRRVTRALFTYPVPFAATQMPLPFSLLPIDHVYAGNRWQPVAVSRGPYAGSDHYPVIVELVMPSVAKES